jgi:ABC-type lipoprotein export system ATPase subunit
MRMLELRQVSRSYGQGLAEVHALREVSLSADEGAMVAVMGPSGSGKSTLLTIAGTLEEPTDGEVLIAGQPVAGMSRNARARLRRRTIGYVFQDFNAQAVMRLLREACQDAGMTAVVVTHDAQLASWADRMVFLRDGRMSDQAVLASGAAGAPGHERLPAPGGTR